MNCICIMGQLEHDSKIVGTQTSFLEMTVVTRRRGTGTYANRIFSERFKVVLYGREIHNMAAIMTAGQWVSVTGEAGAEAWVGANDKKPHGRVKIVAKTLCLCEWGSGNQEAADTSGESKGTPY